MKETALLTATLDAMKAGIEKSSKLGGASVARELSTGIGGDLAVDFVGDVAGRFAGALAVALLRQALGIKDKLSRVEDATKRIEAGQRELNRHLDALVTSHLESAITELSTLMAIEPPYSTGEQEYITGKVVYITRDLRVYEKTMVTIALDESARQDLRMFIDLVCGCAVGGLARLPRIAQQHFAQPRQRLLARAKDLNAALADIPSRVAKLERLIVQYEKDYNERPKIVERTPVRHRPYIPEGDWIERERINPSWARAQELKAVIQDLKASPAAIHAELTLIERWATLMDQLGESA